MNAGLALLSAHWRCCLVAALVLRVLRASVVQPYGSAHLTGAAPDDTMRGSRKEVSMNHRRSCCVFILGLQLALAAASVSGDEVDDLLAVIARAGPQGAGSVESRQASKQLADRSPTAHGERQHI